MAEENVMDFLSKFSFKPEIAGFIGIEREQFLLVNGGFGGGQYAPRSNDFLEAMNDERWTYELSACQVESRTKPQIDLAAVKLDLLVNENMGNQIARTLELRLSNQEVAGIDMLLDVYPEPRYLEIAKNISRERFIAACRVAGTHIHVGVRDIDQAIAVNMHFPWITPQNANRFQRQLL